MKEIADQIAARLKEQGAEVSPEAIEAKLKLLVETFHVPTDEARRSVMNSFLKEHGIAPTAPRGSQELKIIQIKEAGMWVDIKAKVVQLWEPNSDSISQTGLLGDETGAMKFVKWVKADLPPLAEGKSYRFRNLVTDEFQGRFSVKMNRTSQIEEIDEEIEAAERVPAQQVTVDSISQPGIWVDIKAKVVQLWEPNNESISQIGLIGDETGVMKFVKWAKADLPDLAEGKSYRFRNLVTDEFQGRFSVKMNRTSQIEESTEEIEVGSQAAQFAGAIVDIQKGSGLIKRCPICRRSLAKGLCGEHGKVDGLYDLRIKAAMDDGLSVQDVLINRETTESLIGLSLDEAKQMAMEALDHEVIRSLIEERLVGRYYKVEGPRIDRYILVETIDVMPPLDRSELDRLAAEAEVV
ncbi:MAG: replication protein A [Methanotrichaceae archaeon]|nr:replication protein A [Methanotrichaceae archaeon]